MMNANRIVAELTAGSERVKMVDMHPKLPILIASLYTGVVNLWNYETQVLVKSFDIGNKSAVRCARFIPRLQSFICGSDDMHLRVYNYNSMERSKVFLAHDDFIRSIAVHERLTAVLSASDDMTIRQWDWSNNWSLQMVYNGHFSFCMAVMINPRDPSTFASASSDMTVRVWTINNPEANFQLEHEEAVTCLEYYPHGDKPYLLTGTEDHRVQLWDYQTKSCLQTFTHHSEIISSVLFFPGMPLIVTAAQDNELKVISSDTFRLLHSIDHASLGRAWTLTTQPGFNVIAAGFDHGIVVYRVGNDRPVFSMDASGRVVVANGSDLARIDIKGVEASIPDGEVLNLNVKDLGSVEMVPRRIIHNPNGQFMALLGEGEYTTISSLSLRPKTYGKCVAFVWGAESGAYAVLADATTLTIFKSFKEASTCKLQQPAVALYAGPLFAVVYANQGGVAFHNWDGTMIRQIDEVPSNIQWSPSGELMALVADSSMFVLKYNAAEVEEQLVAHGRQMIADGVEAAFDLVEEVDEKVKDAMWASDCLVFVNDANRLNFYMGGEITNVAALSRNTYLLGYVARENRVFCLTKDNTVTSYQLTMKMIEYMTAIVREDFVAAAEILPTMDATHHDKLSAFLRSRGHLELALGVTAEDDPRFNLAMQLNRLDILQEIAERSPSVMRWKQVGDVALKQGRIDVGLAALTRCDDVAGLLLIYSSINDMRAIAELGVVCEEKGKYNVAFTCYRLTQQHEKVVRLLLRCGKAAEASFYARTHMPDLVEETVVAWKGQLSSLPRVRESIANPSSYPNLFPTIHVQPPTTTPVKEMSADVAAPHVDPQPQEPVIPTAVRHEPAPLTSDANPDDDDDNEVEEEDEELEAAGVAPAADEEEDEDEDEDEGEGEEVVGPSTP